MTNQQVKISPVTLFEVYEEADTLMGPRRSVGYADSEDGARQRAISAAGIKAVEAYAITDLKNEVVGHFLKSHLIRKLLIDPEVERIERERARNKYNSLLSERERALLESE